MFSANEIYGHVSLAYDPLKLFASTEKTPKSQSLIYAKITWKPKKLKSFQMYPHSFSMKATLDLYHDFLVLDFPIISNQM
jgi:hypothetical protein